jgi:hypothetical protein
MQGPMGTTAAPGGPDAGTRSPESASPSGSLPGSSSSSSSLTARSANVLSWAAFLAITYAWLWTSKLDKAPWWGPTVCLVAIALPGGMLTEILKTVGLALVDKIPGRGAGK